jgi:hypothetical protein
MGLLDDFGMMFGKKRETAAAAAGDPLAPYSQLLREQLDPAMVERLGRAEDRRAEAARAMGHAADRLARAEAARDDALREGVRRAEAKVAASRRRATLIEDEAESGADHRAEVEALDRATATAVYEDDVHAARTQQLAAAVETANAELQNRRTAEQAAQDEVRRLHDFLTRYDWVLTVSRERFDRLLNLALELGDELAAASCELRRIEKLGQGNPYPVPHLREEFERWHGLPRALTDLLKKTRSRIGYQFGWALPGLTIVPTVVTTDAHWRPDGVAQDEATVVPFHGNLGAASAPTPTLTPANVALRLK